MLNQCRATVPAMQAVRAVNPPPRLIQRTDDLSRTDGTERWTRRSLLQRASMARLGPACGRVTTAHRCGANDRERRGSGGAAVVPRQTLPARHPRIIYVTSDRWLDIVWRSTRPHHSGAREMHSSTSSRSVSWPFPRTGIAALLEEAWDRYRIPNRRDGCPPRRRSRGPDRWLLEIWRAAQGARRNGADVRAVTAWALLGSFDWNCLLTECNDYYEPGPFDIRSEPPRPTAVATLIAELASGRAPSHTLLQGDGWWRRPDRFIAPPMAPRALVTRLSRYRPEPASGPMRRSSSASDRTLVHAFAPSGRAQPGLSSRVRDEIDSPTRIRRPRPRRWHAVGLTRSGYVRIARRDRRRALLPRDTV